jgi:hypothetical protein
MRCEAPTTATLVGFISGVRSMARPAGAESSRLENGRERGSRGLADYRSKPVACQTRARTKPSLTDGA